MSLFLRIARIGVLTLLLTGGVTAALWYYSAPAPTPAPVEVPVRLPDPAVAAGRALRWAPQPQRPPELLQARYVEGVDTVEADTLPELPTAPVPPDSGASHVQAAPVLPPRVVGEKASFSLKVKDVVSPYQVLGVFVMPGETVDLETLFTRPGQRYTLTAEAGTATVEEAGRWTWTAPDVPGAYTLYVEGPFETVQLNAFVKTPFNNADPELDGYHIGAYERKPRRNNPRYKPPAGLIEVNETTAGLRVSPHFTLGAFTCHQPGDPKFLLLDERLVLKLELLLEEVQQRGIDATTFTVMSGYRTPWYNKSIGNTTKYSLHLFGRAADIFIDEDGDGRMDDLNNDGQVDEADAQVLFDIAADMDTQASYQPFIGGLGLYGPKPHRGPFVHVDARGYTARW